MDLKFWKKALREAEQELEAATTCTAIDAAAKRVMLAKRELKRLEQRAPIRQGSGAATYAASS